MAVTQASETTLAKTKNIASNRSNDSKNTLKQAKGSVTWYNTNYYSPAAEKILRKTKNDDKRRRETFLNSFGDPVIAKVIEDSRTFADILNYAIQNNFIKQNELSRRIGYANSQVGRWAAHKSSPPMLVRRAVLKEVVDMVNESLAAFD